MKCGDCVLMDCVMQSCELVNEPTEPENTCGLNNERIARLREQLPGMVVVERDVAYVLINNSAKCHTDEKGYGYTCGMCSKGISSKWDTDREITVHDLQHYPECPIAKLKSALVLANGGKPNG